MQWLMMMTAASALATDGGPHVAHAPEAPDTRLAETDSVRPLELHAWAAVGYEATIDASGDAHASPFINLARVQTRVLDKGFGAFLQFAADDGQPALLDARATWRPSDHFWLRAGRFMTPVSAEWLVPAHHLLLRRRGVQTELVTDRALGAEAHIRVPVGAGMLLLQPGVFDPVGGTQPVLGVGQQAVGRVFYQHPSGLGLHGAVSAWLHPDDVALKLGEDTPTHDRAAVLAALFEDHVWTAVIEGVWARPLVGVEHSWAASATLARRFDTHWEGIQFEPVVALEGVRSPDLHEQIATVGFNVHHHDWRVVQLVAAEVEHHPGMTAVSGYVQLRAGI